MIRIFLIFSVLLNISLIGYKFFASKSIDETSETSKTEDIKPGAKTKTKKKVFPQMEPPEPTPDSKERWSKIQIPVQANAESLNNPMQSYYTGVVGLIQNIDDLKKYLQSDEPRSHKSQLINQLGLSRSQKGFNLLVELFQSRENHQEFVRDILQGLSHYKGEPLKAMLLDFYRNDWANEEETVIAAYYLTAMYGDTEAKAFLEKEAMKEKSRAHYYLKRLDQLDR